MVQLADFDEFDEFMDEDEFYDESDEFLGDVWRWATKPKSTQRRVALSAAKSALGSAGAWGGAAGQLIGSRWGLGSLGKLAGQTLGSTIGGGLAGLLPNEEAMSYLAESAANTEDEEEAEAFIGALIPLAAQIIPHVAPTLMRAAPHLIRGATQVARTLRSQPGTQHFVRTLPTIVSRTAANIANQVSQGRRVTPATASRHFARQTYRVLQNPRAAHKAMRRCKRLNYRFRQRTAH